MLKCGRALQLSETETGTGLDIGTHGHQLKGQQSRIGNRVADGAILKVEGSHRRQGYGGQERLKAEVKAKTKSAPSKPTGRRTFISCTTSSPRGG
jgi:hypothetical protein